MKYIPGGISRLQPQVQLLWSLLLKEHGSEPCHPTPTPITLPPPYSLGLSNSSHDTHRSSGRWSSHIQPRFSWKKGRGMLNSNNGIVLNLHPTAGQCKARTLCTRPYIHQQVWFPGIQPSVQCTVHPSNTSTVHYRKQKARSAT